MGHVVENPIVYSMFRIELVDRLAELYKTDYVAVAKVCDEALDRSGALLGEVRARHRELISQQKRTQGGAL
jgi:hypothetical protein